MAPDEMRALAEGLAAANTENHRRGEHVPAVADRAAAALRDAADRLDAVQAWVTACKEDGWDMTALDAILTTPTDQEASK